jgi:uncharacterized membrane protein YeaQ/YmgE (transglycosylase-associated protein family)
VFVVVFISLGLIAGYVALGLFESTGTGVVLDLGLGVAGAVLVGSLFEHIAATGTAGSIPRAGSLLRSRGPPRCSPHSMDCATRAIAAEIRSDRISKVPVSATWSLILCLTSKHSPRCFQQSS